MASAKPPASGRMASACARSKRWSWIGLPSKRGSSRFSQFSTGNPSVRAGAKSLGASEDSVSEPSARLKTTGWPDPNVNPKRTVAASAETVKASPVLPRRSGATPATRNRIDPSGLSSVRAGSLTLATNPSPHGSISLIELAPKGTVLPILCPSRSKMAEAKINPLSVGTW